MNSIEKDISSLEGFVFPFEGEKHLCTVVELPYRKDTWRLGAAPAISEYWNVVKAISEYESVVVVADPGIPYSVVKTFVMDHVTVLRLPYDDSWARDNTPVFLRNPKTDRLAAVDYGFNAWGGTFDGLYDKWDDDNRLGNELAHELYIHHFARKDFILEGGSIHTDGEGTLLVTECCLLSQGRNPNLTKEQIEENLKSTLNVDKVLWLPEGIYNDETDGHVDNICCFARPGTVLLAWTDDESDPQYALSRKDYEYLSSVTDAKGRKLEIIKVMLPKPKYMTKEEAEGIANPGTGVERLEGRRLAASYINFYLGEKFVLLPQFGDPQDEKAVAQFREIFPDHEIIPIASREILLGGGNIHCITKQVPYSALTYYENEAK